MDEPSPTISSVTRDNHLFTISVISPLLVSSVFHMSDSWEITQCKNFA